MLIRDLFVSDVTRDIPPVVYFHEQSPDKLAAEVSEYIITGGWPENHPNHKRVPNGIHEQYVRLLKAMALELDKPGGPELPTAWISGFYGSGKSSFAKLLGLALDGVALPDGTSLIEALLRRDTSPRAQKLRDAWHTLRQKIDPMAVVFDVGSVARHNEHIHAAAVRQVQVRLGYCRSEPLVADYELKLERDGEWQSFEQKALEVLGRPWQEVKDRALIEDDFSLILSELYPQRYTDPLAWITSRAGTHSRAESPEEAVGLIRDMLEFRNPGATLFLVIDEVSQYVLSNQDRVDRLRAFATALGAGLKGRAWLLALGQQKLDEEAGDAFLAWAKDRFPPQLRVHLAATNIRDVVHKRLLQKKPEAEKELHTLFEKHRADLKLFAYKCAEVTPDEFVEVYPLLPEHIDLLLRITSALRTRSARAQGDDQAIRGLLQLLGELFRDQKLADQPMGTLVTLDQIYEIQHTALDSDVQDSMARILRQCADDPTDLAVRAAKAVALLELIQENVPTDAALVAQCLYDRVDRGNRKTEVLEALETLRRRNLLGYSEQHGYKIQSTAGEEWERERRDIGVPRDTIGARIQEALKYLMGTPDRPRLENRPFPWGALYSDGRRAEDVGLVDPRDDAMVQVDFRFLTTQEERLHSLWIKRSAEFFLANRLVWVVGESEQVDHLARELSRSLAMVNKYRPRRESLKASRKLLYQQEENRYEELGKQVREAVAEAWMAGKMYFRGRPISPRDLSSAFAPALLAAGNNILKDLFPHFKSIQVQPTELSQLLTRELSGVSAKFTPGALEILQEDRGRYVATCDGVVPRRILEHIEAEGGLGGGALLAHFARPPYGYTVNVVKACVAGLLRAGKVRVQPEGGGTITAIRDTGVNDLIIRDRNFRRAAFFPHSDDTIGPRDRARICKLFEKNLQVRLEREDEAIADAVAEHFPRLARRLQGVLARHQQLPGTPPAPKALSRLDTVLSECISMCRQTEPTVKLVKTHLDDLQDGLALLAFYHAELTDETVEAVKAVARVRDQHLAQLETVEALTPEAAAAAQRVRQQLNSERPWQELGSLDPDLEQLKALYARERGDRLLWQEKEAEAARARVKARPGFCTLSGDKTHKVLRPIALATTDTTAEALKPTLVDLRDRFFLALREAEERSNELLDELIMRGQGGREGKPPQQVVKVALGLHNRELATEAEVDALLREVRERLMSPIKKGHRVRVV